MEKVVYLILSRKKDTFNVIYADDCEKTTENGFFTQNIRFKCWLDEAGSEQFLYLAILPMFDSMPKQRKQVVSKIIARYKPACNMKYVPEEKPDPEKISCPCCGSDMKIERVLEKSSIVKCPECGLSDTKLNS